MSVLSNILYLQERKAKKPKRTTWLNKSVPNENPKNSPKNVDNKKPPITPI
jgi:hypothetical protein